MRIFHPAGHSCHLSHFDRDKSQEGICNYIFYLIEKKGRYIKEVKYANNAFFMSVINTVDSAISMLPEATFPEAREIATYLNYFSFQNSMQVSLPRMKHVIAKREKKVTLMVFLMVMAFVGAWTPYATIAILRIWGIDIADYGVVAAMMVSKLASWGNTLVLIFLNREVYNTYMYFKCLINTLGSYSFVI